SHLTDPITAELRASAAAWHDIGRLDDRAIADRIRTDRIDILVDLSGHTDGNRLKVFAPHPAPVQVTWLGYLNTTGLSTIDYRICDSRTDPAGVSDALHSEKLYRMPCSQWCY